jgi:segregation and condensation protein B
MTNNNLSAKLQALLLLSAKPLKFRELAAALSVDEEQVQAAVAQLKEQLNQDGSGWWLIEAGKSAQLATNPRLAEFIESYLEVEQTTELTRPALEALTIIAYCGPVGKMALDRIRGVNCSLIVRNLLIKGLIEEIKEAGEVKYQVTMDFIKHLGLSDIKELPDYDKLHRHEYLVDMIGSTESQETVMDNKQS